MIGCGSGWSRCWRIRPAVSVIRAAAATRRGCVSRGCCSCCLRGCVMWICRASSVFAAERRAGAGCMSGSRRVCGSGRCGCLWPNSMPEALLTGRALSLTRRWWMQKGGRPGRPQPCQQGLSLQQVPPRCRWRRPPRSCPGRPGQRERTGAPAAADRSVARRRLPAGRGLGRPRLLQRSAPRRARRTRDQPSDQQTPQTGFSTTARHDSQRGPPTGTGKADSRPTCTSPLGRRAHQRLDPTLPPTHDPHRTQQHRLPRLPHPRPAHHPQQVIVSSVPGEP